ncbi:hypothetical protein ACRALDRAFT_1072206 [Sodiomyces alcalophilus JCM 7366]|uniref:uncharacterized protein n=1 Tax=Sodiomyces alcalophilus JCM 7366 TaxID=591952 RepID=UPI0039B47AA0
MATNNLIRDEYPIPPVTIPEESSTWIKFHHPAYTARTSVFLRLPRVDLVSQRDGESGPKRGVHHHTALLACQLIANNSFGGRLFIDRDGRDEVQVSLDDILLADNYYFIVDTSNPKLRYPIVPSFRDWTFPDKVPASWPEPSTTNGSMLSADGRDRCALTNHCMGLKNAHLVPKAEEPWADREDMEIYGAHPTIHITGTGTRGKNVLPLRADIHRCFDSREFAIVPKREIYDPAVREHSRPRYVVHCLGHPRDSDEFWSLYHNVPLQYIGHLSKEALLTRFAWTVFLGVRFFLLKGQTRSIVRCLTDKEEQRAEEMEGAALRDLYRGGGSREASATSSPWRERKRRRVGEGDGDSDTEEEWRGTQDGESGY